MKKFFWGGEPRLFDGSRQHGNVQVTDLQLLKLIERQVDIEFEHDARIVFVDRGNELGKPGHGDEFGYSQPDHAR